MDSCTTPIRLIPRARANQIAGERDGRLLVRVTAPPLDGRANTALCRLLANAVGVGVRRVSVVQGASAREKLLRIDGMSAVQLRQALKLKPPTP